MKAPDTEASTIGSHAGGPASNPDPPSTTTVDTETKKGWFKTFLESSLATAIITGILTSLIAPSIIERSKSADAQAQLKVTTATEERKRQIEVVEKLSGIVWTYRTAANWVVWDRLHGDPISEEAKKHIRDYDDVAARTNREFLTEAFRARMYFDSEAVHNRLIKLFSSLMKIDAQISFLLAEKNRVAKTAITSPKRLYEAKYQPLDSAMPDNTARIIPVGTPQFDEGTSSRPDKAQWKEIEKQITDIEEYNSVLNDLFQLAAHSKPLPDAAKNPSSGVR
jgi:hypothetical protein